MKPISEAWCCQIELTNFCGHDCLYCSRHNKHIRKDQRFFMSTEFLESALDSLKDWPGKIGIIGGEPLLHPEFEKCCKIIQSKFDRGKMGLWTSGGSRWESLKPFIDETFVFVAYNEHNKQQKEVCKHQPLTLAICDLVPDVELREKLIDDCWVQRTWCPTISPKGAFFCEVAYALDLIFDGPGGFEITEDWWKRTPEEYKKQRDRYCKFCGMALPYERELIKNTKEKFSKTSLSLFQKHNLKNIEDDKIELIDTILNESDIKKIAKTWFPGNYRGDNQEDSTCIEGKGSTLYEN